MITIRKATPFDVAFMEDCIDQSYRINDYAMSLVDMVDAAHPAIYIPKSAPRMDETEEQANLNRYWLMMCKYLTKGYGHSRLQIELDHFIVNRNGRDVGFFTNDYDPTNSTLGGTSWIHPSSCSMAMIAITQACVIRGNLYGSSIGVNHYEFDIAHPLMIRAAKKISPELVEHKIYADYRVIYASGEAVLNGSNKAVKALPFENLNETDFTFGIKL